MRMREVYTTSPRARQEARCTACYGLAAVRRYPATSNVLSIVFLAALAGSGCAVVKANQRGNLAKRAMTNDRDTGEARFAQHAHGAREGADGGTGQPGGGCGCN
jgi:hypothetical protein